MLLQHIQTGDNIVQLKRFQIQTTDQDIETLSAILQPLLTAFKLPRFHIFME
jgi:hypothetical protein